MRQPTPVEPVKEIMSTSGEVVMASAASTLLAETTLTTPAGKPASSNSSPMRMTPSGSWTGGLTTTVLPMARAGATLPAMLVTGKL